MTTAILINYLSKGYFNIQSILDVYNIVNNATEMVYNDKRIIIVIMWNREVVNIINLLSGYRSKVESAGVQEFIELFNEVTNYTGNYASCEKLDN